MGEITPVALLVGAGGAGGGPVLRDALSRCGPAGIAIVTAQPEPPMWWRAGCPCCVQRDDITRALRSLLPRARRGEVRRVVIAAPGAVDPASLLATLLCDTVAASAYRLDTIIAVLDAAQGTAALDGREAAVRQVAAADRIVLTNTGRAEPTDLMARLRRVNPGALLVDPRLDPGALLRPGLFDPAVAVPDLYAWLNVDAFAAAVAAQGHAARETLANCLTFTRPLSRTRAMAWLERLILAHGDAVLRMKAILNLAGETRPVAIHSIGHQLHPAVTLPAWPADDAQCSRLGFIATGLSLDDFTPGVLAAG